jgi:hypothetical protein
MHPYKSGVFCDFLGFLGGYLIDPAKSAKNWDATSKIQTKSAQIAKICLNQPSPLYV